MHVYRYRHTHTRYLWCARQYDGLHLAASSVRIIEMVLGSAVRVGGCGYVLKSDRHRSYVRPNNCYDVCVCVYVFNICLLI